MNGRLCRIKNKEGGWGDGNCKKKPDKAALDTNHRAEFIKLIDNLAMKYSGWRVFEDFLGMAALSISNSVDWTHHDEREAQYLEIVGRYERQEIDLFPQMMFHLTEELEKHAEEPCDVLGKIFHELELHNKYKGQFFTPQHICDFMGMCALGENDHDIAQKGYIALSEPCCGSGAMVLGFYKAMLKNGYDPQRQMVVTATDVDIKCVHMCYLQLSLYGIPAVVIHGNTITMKEFSRWYTPVYMLEGWVWRQACGNLNTLYPEDEAIKQASEPTYAAMRKVESFLKDAEPPINTLTEATKENDAPKNEQLQIDLGYSAVTAVEPKNTDRKRTVSRRTSKIFDEQLSLFS